MTVSENTHMLTFALGGQCLPDRPYDVYKMVLYQGTGSQYRVGKIYLITAFSVPIRQLAGIKPDKSANQHVKK